HKRSAGSAGHSPRASCSAATRSTRRVRGFHTGSASQPSVSLPYALSRWREYTFSGFTSDASSAARRYAVDPRYRSASDHGADFARSRRHDDVVMHARSAAITPVYERCTVEKPTPDGEGASHQASRRAPTPTTRMCASEGSDALASTLLNRSAG